MKPQEIRAMVEEATGAARYELKKKNSQVLIEKKQTALNMIDNLLNEDIGPMLLKLQQEQSGLQEFNQLNAELEHAEKVNIAYQYVQSNEICESAGTRVSEMRNNISTKETEIENLHDSVRTIEEQVKKLEIEKDKEFGGRLTELDEELKQAQMNEAKLVTQYNNDKDNLNEAVKKQKTTDRGYQSDKKLQSNKQKEFDSVKGKFEDLKAAVLRDETAVAKAQKNFEAISAGASRADDGEAAGTLSEQLLQAKDESARLGTELKKVNMNLKNLKPQLASKEKEARKSSSDSNEANRKVEAVRSECTKLRSQMDSMQFDESEYHTLREERRKLAQEVGMFSDGIKNAEYRMPELKIEYNKRGIDETKVIGKVCNLFTVKDEKFAVAIEECIGGRMYNVVVQDQDTAKKILDSNSLRTRTTFLPLDRMNAKDFDRRALNNAHSLVGRENVFAAIDLIDYDKRYHKAMQNVFGDTLICTNMSVGKQVAYAGNVRKKTITLDGEVFNPSGTLSGGSRRDGNSSILKQISDLNKQKIDLNQMRVDLENMEHRLRELDETGKKYQAVKKSFEIKDHELKLLEKHLENTNQFQLAKEIQELRAQIDELEAQIVNLPEQAKAADAKVNQLNHKMKNAKSLREKELKDAESQLKSCQQAHDKSVKVMAEKQEFYSSLKEEIVELASTLETYEVQLQEMRDEIKKLEDVVKASKAEVENAKQAVRDKAAEVEEQKKLYKSKSDDISKMIKKKDQANKQIEAKSLEIKKLGHNIEEFMKSTADERHRLKSLLKKYTWINEEKALFGSEKEGYPFKRTDFNIKDVRAEIEAKTLRKQQLAKTVNMRAGTMLSDREKQAKDVQERRKIVESDKKKLIDYMQQVDLKKKQELEKAYLVINSNFGSIFSSMLPGTQAKLEPPAGKTIHDGLEVRVAFGSVWKETLTELSGGQRSLVALSLILSLLRYNPAPIYILDEVDAALDQSHTTNIGRMIKENFPDSQVSFR